LQTAWALLFSTIFHVLEGFGKMSVKFDNLFAIAIGGALGTLLRYQLNIKLFFNYMPNATIIENLVGSFFLGCLAGWLFHKMLPEWLKLGLGVGLLGGFTTMSTFAADTFSIFALNSAFGALKYLSITLFGALAMAATGFVVGNYFGTRNKCKDREGSFH
jgi:fluoride exporter